MSLDELNNKLHSRDFHADRVHTPGSFEPGAPSEVSPSGLGQTEAWGDVETQKARAVPKGLLQKKHYRFIAFAVGGIALVSLIGLAFGYRSSLFKEENLIITFTGPTEIESNERATFIFEYSNDNWVDLQNAVIVFEYPETFQPDTLGDFVLSGKTHAEKSLVDGVPSRGQGKVMLSGKFFGSRGERVVVSGALRYSPGGLTSSFEKRVKNDVRIASSPLFFEIVAPDEIVSDQEVQYEIRYGNNGTTALSNLRVKLEYPEGFTFTDAEPQPSEENTVWALDTLVPRGEGKIIVRGRLHGERDQQKWLHGEIGVVQGGGSFASYAEHEGKTRVVASPFSINQVANGGNLLINPGEQITYTIEYRNDGNVGVRDAILTMEIDSPYVDFSTLSFSGNTKGAYIQSKKSIVWKASDLPALSRVEPGQGGKAGFSIRVYSDLRTRFPQARDLSVQSVAKIDSPDIPALNGLTKVVASSGLSMRVNTAVTTTIQAYYQDTVFPNTGPIPPVLGQETTYTVHFAVTNTFNDVENAKVNISLPTGIRYTGKRSPEEEKMTFNNRTNELFWDLGTVGAGKVRELVFQIAVTPDPVSVGHEVTLLSSALFTGKDAYTGKDIRIEKEKKTNIIPEDPSVTEYNVRSATP